MIPNYPNANLRHYHFLQQGLRDVAEDAAERGIGFIVRRAPETLEAFLEEVQAALLIGDENPCREPERWRRVLARRLKIPYWTVDADVVVPSRVFNRSFVLLHHFRPHLKAELPKFLVAPKKIEPLHHMEAHARRCPAFPLAEDITAGFTKLDRTVKPVDTFTGGHARGAQAAQRVYPPRSGRLRRQPQPPRDRRHKPPVAVSALWQHRPADDCAGGRRCCRQGQDSRRDEASDILEQLIGWRELAVLFVRHEPNYDNWECAAPWARKTLLEHAGDPRPTATHSSNWSAPKPTTSCGTRRSARW